MIDLNTFAPEHVDFEAMADVLCKLARYDGCTPGYTYTVGQHSIEAYHLAHRLGHPEAAPRALIHDFHESIIGDQTTPAVSFMAEQCLWSSGREQFKRAVKMAKQELDLVIFEAAGIDYWDWEQEQIVKRIDRILLTAERLKFLPDTPDYGWSNHAADRVPDGFKISDPKEPVIQASYLKNWLDVLPSRKHLALERYDPIARSQLDKKARLEIV